jgi:DNA-binding LytR/AlgR family response regulator
MSYTALIAEDEPLLARALQAELARLWPELQIVSTVGDGLSAVQQCLALRPDIAFLDIRMPGQSGLDAAADLVDQWPDDSRPFPALVFVTAYDQYAVQAFEAHAVDYVLKPVQAVRLGKTVHKLHRLLDSRAPAQARMQTALAQLQSLLASASPPATVPASQAPKPLAPLRVIQASVGNAIHMVAVDDVQYFEAADKYVRVLTASHEYLIRTPLKELILQLDPQQFWQIHRGTVVRLQAMESVLRDESGKLVLKLLGRSERLGVSRLYAEQFKGM